MAFLPIGIDPNPSLDCEAFERSDPTPDKSLPMVLDVLLNILGLTALMAFLLSMLGLVASLTSLIS